MIDQITSGKGSIPLKTLRNLMIKYESVSGFNQITVIALNHSILLRSVSVRRLMKNHM